MPTQTERKATIVGPFATTVKPTSRTAPSSASAADIERVNAAAERDVQDRQARAVVGSGDVVALRVQREDAERVAAAQAAESARVAAGGGLEVTTALRGDVGRGIADVLRLDEIGAAARKLRGRIDGEIVELNAQQQAQAERDYLDGLLADGWDAAAAKQRVPDVLGPLMHWVGHVRPEGRPEGFADAVYARINQQHAECNTERVAERVEDADAVLVSAAVGVLESAGAAADVLAGVGLSVDASAEEIVNADSGSAEAGAAWKQWREAVGVWSDVQSCRRWLSVALAVGFDAKHPDSLAGVGVSQIEAAVWSAQWVGVSMDYVQGSGAALSWWLSHGRPQAAGIHIDGKVGVQ